jgi:enoyl-CoA hydratase/carnithine racemase
MTRSPVPKGPIMSPQADTEDTVLVSRDGDVTRITLNRPAARNAITPPMVMQLIAAVDAADGDDGVRAIIFTGAGDAYSAGADLSGGGAEFRRSASDVEKGRRDLGGLLTLRLFACSKPLIGAVNGVAAGLGATMLLPMDVRMAATSARFGFVFSRRGIVPEACSSWFLPRVVGISRAVEWTMSGRVFGADEALQAGLLHSLHEPPDLLSAAHAMAKELTRVSSSLSVAATRQLMWRGLAMIHPAEAHRVESRLLGILGPGPDAVEGITAFLEKRDPVFPSRLSAELPGVLACWHEPGGTTSLD